MWTDPIVEENCRLRDELKTALMQTNADIAAGKFVKETAEQHLARLKTLEIEPGDISADIEAARDAMVERFR